MDLLCNSANWGSDLFGLIDQLEAYLDLLFENKSGVISLSGVNIIFCGEILAS